MPLEPIKPLISDKSLERYIVVTWIVSGAIFVSAIYVAAHFIAKFW